LAYRIALSGCHSGTKGFAAPEVETELRRARELCNPAEDSVSLFHVLEGLRRLHMFRLEMEPGRALALEQFAIAQRLNDPRILARGHTALGITLLWLGEAVSADDQLSTATRLFEARCQGDDYRIVALSYYSLALCIVGWPEKAASVSSESLALGQLLRHSPWMGLALDLAWDVNRLLGDRRMAKNLAEHELSLASEIGSLLTYGTFHVGFSSVEDGRIEEGISKMCSALEAFKAAGVAATNWLTAAIGESYLKTDRRAEGLTILDTALTLTERTGDQLFEAELRRLKGELVLSHDQAAGARAEACFRDAIAIARLQGAKSWELRATTSLARLLAKQGRRDEARAMLAEIYNWFTEGFDTADLKDAKALLDELGT
jgi:tetratricopeptide (TPR) repeat protein